MTPCMLHQNAPHQLRRNREKMGAILPLHAFIIHQTHVRLVDQGCCLQAVAGPLTSHVAPRQAVQFAIDDGSQPVERALVSLAPCAQQLADVARGRSRGLCSSFHRSADYTAALNDSFAPQPAPTKTEARKYYEIDSDFDRGGQLARHACDGAAIAALYPHRSKSEGHSVQLRGFR